MSQTARRDSLRFPTYTGAVIPDFPHRSGFARHGDLEHPRLRELLELCLKQSQAFSGRAQLDWSRQWEYPYVLANLPSDGAGRQLLDAGSGYRFLTPLFARRGFEVHACDVDASVGRRLDALAEQENLPIRFTRQDLARMDYPDESFDAIVCVSVLEHAHDPWPVVAELRRCLRAGGTLILTFDVSVRGDRDIPVHRARDLIELLERELEPRHAFTDSHLLDEAALATSEDVLRTEWFRRHQPELLPWRRISKTGLANLRRGRLGRPFFDLAVVGLILTKRPPEPPTKS